MHFILDRRSTKGNVAENRQKFLKRVRHIVRDSMQDSFKTKSIKDIGTTGHDVVIDAKKIGKSLDEPHFSYDFHGDEKWVMPGNKEFTQGDEIDKPKGGAGGGGKKASQEGQGEDPFVVHITQEEFLNYFFEDLELPELTKKDLTHIDDYRIKNAGYTSSGSPSRLSVVRSMKQSMMRRMALQSPMKGELAEKNIMLDRLLASQMPSLLHRDIRELEDKISKVPYIDTIDLRYRNPKKEAFPSTSATMICIMDNSGSMGEREKTLSRKFFYLLYLFLTRRYKKIDLLFIHHTTQAREVTEEEFFNMKESGGTVVSSALVLAKKMIEEKGLSKTNLYICQCSDGDNWGDEDNKTCLQLLNDDILPVTQYYAYIQIQPVNGDYSGHNTGYNSLWKSYEKGISDKGFAQQLIYSDKDIYPVFRKLFEKKAKISR